MSSKIRDAVVCICSAGLLVLANPGLNWWLLAWVALVPLLVALEGKRVWSAFALGYLTGVVFFAGTLFWFIHVTLPGMILMVLYLSVYFGIFCAGYVVLRGKNVLLNLLVVPALWVAAEHVRGTFLSGFGWVSLGHSQFLNLPMIQIADVTGVAGVSFVLVMVNVLLAEVWMGGRQRAPARVGAGLLRPAAAAVLILALVFGYGAWRLSPSASAGGKHFRIAVIQGNVPQELKWDAKIWPSVFKKYLDLTRRAAAQRPDLIIWPETSYPGYPWESPEIFQQLKDFVKEIKIPLLFGTVMFGDGRYYNSALLIDEHGKVVRQYNKLHLVPFGEFIPARKLLPFLQQIVPIADFTAGKEWTLFPVSPSPNPQRPQISSPGRFSVLICFEDTVASLARRFVREGADFLVNITNDAWFEDTKAPFLHLQAAVFRTVENRRPLVRSANTGVSCLIDQFGRVTTTLRGDAGRATFVPGYSVGEISAGNAGTFYTKFGDVFTYLCFGCILPLFLIRRYFNL